MTTFQKEEAVKTNELERDVNGFIQKDTRKKKYKDRSMKIEFYSHQLNENKISVKRFLKLMCHVDNKIVFDEGDYPVLDPNELEFESLEDLKEYENIIAGTDLIEITMKDRLEPDDVIDITTETITAEKVTTGRATRKRVTTKRATTKRAATEEAVENSTVLTRSKARKLASAAQQGVTTDASTGSKSKRQRDESLDSENNSNSKKSTNDLNIDGDTFLQSSSNELVRLTAIFHDICEEKLIIASDSRDCVMGCGRGKGTVLLPCKHQPTCRQCYVMWNVFLDEDKKSRFCPICKCCVVNHIAVAD